MGLNPTILRQARVFALSFSSRCPPPLAGSYRASGLVLCADPVLPEAHTVGALSAEAVRKGDVQEPMRERPGSAVEFAGGLGSGLIDQSQKMTAAAMQIAEK